MSPIDLPPQNPTNALQADRERPRITVIVADHSPVPPVSPVGSHDHHDRPHGGDPRVQRVRVDLTSSTVSSTAAFFDVDQPWLNSESDRSLDDAVLRQVVNIVRAVANAKSTEGQTHKQHKDKNVRVPKQTKRT